MSWIKKSYVIVIPFKSLFLKHDNDNKTVRIIMRAGDNIRSLIRNIVLS